MPQWLQPFRWQNSLWILGALAWFPALSVMADSELSVLQAEGAVRIEGESLARLYADKTHYGVDDEGREAVIYYDPAGERRLRALGRRFTTDWWMDDRGRHCVDAVIGGVSCGWLIRIGNRLRHCTVEGRCRYWVTVVDGNPEGL